MTTVYYVIQIGLNLGCAGGRGPGTGRAVVPIHDAMARATFHLLVHPGGRGEAGDVFEWVRDR